MAGKRRVTRNDVAERAGVSPAVVSYVLNKTKYVSPEKTRAVEEAIKELHYIPNFTARNLKTNKSMQIAFVCDNLRNDWLELAESNLFEKGYYVSHCYTRDNEDFIQMLIARRFDGVLMLSNFFSTEQLNEIAEAGIPVALYRTRDYGELHSNIKTVVPDYQGGVEKCVNYLVMRGHKNIAMIPPLRYKYAAETNYRYQAYVSTLEKNGIPFREAFYCKSVNTIEEVQAYAVDVMLNTDPADRPTAFIASNDYIALHLIATFQQLGLRVPEDVAVTGCDNTFLAKLTTPPLTSVDFSKELFAKQVADTLLSMIDGKKAEDRIIPVSLVIRGTT